MYQNIKTKVVVRFQTRYWQHVLVLSCKNDQVRFLSVYTLDLGKVSIQQTDIDIECCTTAPYDSLYEQQRHCWQCFIVSILYRCR